MIFQDRNLTELQLASSIISRRYASQCSHPNTLAPILTFQAFNSCFSRTLICAVRSTHSLIMSFVVVSCNKVMNQQHHSHIKDCTRNAAPSMNPLTVLSQRFVIVNPDMPVLHPWYHSQYTHKTLTLKPTTYTFGCCHTCTYIPITTIAGRRSPTMVGRVKPRHLESLHPAG